VIEVRWHGRAGQGAKTASQLLAAAALERGMFVQSFPDYGPERSGAPMRAYTRIDDAPIRRRYGITEPTVVVVLDESLLREVDVREGLREHGVLIVNTERPIPGARTVPASRIAAAGAGYVNVVMLGAVGAAIREPLDGLVAAAEAKSVAAKDVAAGYHALSRRWAA
jgi:pyruvate ferredoxin oxidoreductase gamma subunit